MQIDRSNIVVTGGASGIGKGMCERFAALGASVVVADLDGDGAQAVAEDIGGIAVTCDVADQESVTELVESAIASLGHIDLFCANAGVGVGGGIDAPLELWDLNVAVNVMGPVHAARAVIPHMTQRGGGSLMITGSAAGLITGPVSFNYAVSKHAAIGVAEWLAINYGPQIKVSCLCPTIVDTPMIDHFGRGMVEPLTVDEVVDAVVEGLADERFLILPSPGPLDMFQMKAQDYDGFIAGVQQRLAAMRG